MTTREMFMRLMRERRGYRHGSLDWRYRTAAARKLYWILRGIPTDRWPEDQGHAS